MFNTKPLYDSTSAFIEGVIIAGDKVICQETKRILLDRCRTGVPRNFLAIYPKMDDRRLRLPLP